VLKGLGDKHKNPAVLSRERDQVWTVQGGWDLGAALYRHVVPNLVGYCRRCYAVIATSTNVKQLFILVYVSRTIAAKML
jgi:hypothetical protein